MWFGYRVFRNPKAIFKSRRFAFDLDAYSRKQRIYADIKLIVKVITLYLRSVVC